MERTVILAAGDFPKKGGEPRRILASASRVVACDSAADEFRRVFRRWPDVTVGDLDSVGSVIPPGTVRDDDDSVNDLAKAIAHCARMGWRDPIVLGATGKREDHTIGNVFHACEAQVRICTESGDFLPVLGRRTFRTRIDAGVSVFAPDPATRMKSRGLRWKLDGVTFDRIWRATLNRASGENVTVESDRAAYVFVERSRASRRVAVSLGSNLGDRAKNLSRALAALARLPRTRLLDASSVIETEPVGVPERFSSMTFLNQAAVLETESEPLEFFAAAREIEDRLGRVRTVRNGPRTVDIDLISFEGVEMSTPDLTIPHPRASSRDFVVKPMREIGLEVGKW